MNAKILHLVGCLKGCFQLLFFEPKFNNTYMQYQGT